VSALLIIPICCIVFMIPYDCPVSTNKITLKLDCPDAHGSRSRSNIRRLHGCFQPPQAGARAGTTALHRRNHDRRISQIHREGQGKKWQKADLPAAFPFICLLRALKVSFVYIASYRPSSAASSRSTLANRRPRTLSPYYVASRRDTRSIMAFAYVTRLSSQRRGSAAATCPIASSLTRPST
jgi:hypothetical protein